MSLSRWNLLFPEMRMLFCSIGRGFHGSRYVWLIIVAASTHEKKEKHFKGMIMPNEEKQEKSRRASNDIWARNASFFGSNPSLSHVCLEWKHNVICKPARRGFTFSPFCVYHPAPNSHRRVLHLVPATSISIHLLLQSRYSSLYMTVQSNSCQGWTQYAR